MRNDTTNAQPMSITSRDVLTDGRRRGALLMREMTCEDVVELDCADKQLRRDDSRKQTCGRNANRTERTFKTGVDAGDVRKNRGNEKRIVENGKR